MSNNYQLPNAEGAWRRDSLIVVVTKYEGYLLPSCFDFSQEGRYPTRPTMTLDDLPRGHWLPLTARGAEGEVAELRRQVAAANDRVRIVLDSMKWNGDGYDWTGGEFDYRMDPAKAVTNTERLVASLRHRAESAEQRIALAGGYHARTPREIEIEEALRCVDPADAGPEDVAIEELLELVDAGRNRVHEEIEKRESAEQQLAAATKERDAWKRAALYDTHENGCLCNKCSLIRAAFKEPTDASQE